MTSATGGQELKRGSHRDALLEAGLEQFFDRGYHGTTVDGLLESTGVPKGSFYHHFGSKESFAVVVLERYGRFHHALLARWAAREDLSTADILAGYFDECARIFIDSGYRYTDLAGKLATEVAGESDVLHAQIARFVTEWRTQLEAVLRAGQLRGEVRRDRSPADISAAIHALIDGFFVIAAATHRPEFVNDIETAITTMIVGM
ncbi:hypothetical protein BHQ15_17370 [Mycolicibacillus koreensis]|nr:hypothetical protein BHQ15_17370 [Mycolicibacillus koreensis]